MRSILLILGLFIWLAGSGVAAESKGQKPQLPALVPRVDSDKPEGAAENVKSAVGNMAVLREFYQELVAYEQSTGMTEVGKKKEQAQYRSMFFSQKKILSEELNKLNKWAVGAKGIDGASPGGLGQFKNLLGRFQKPGKKAAENGAPEAPDPPPAK